MVAYLIFQQAHQKFEKYYGDKICDDTANDCGSNFHIGVSLAACDELQTGGFPPATSSSGTPGEGEDNGIPSVCGSYGSSTDKYCDDSPSNCASGYVYGYSVAECKECSTGKWKDCKSAGTQTGGMYNPAGVNETLSDGESVKVGDLTFKVLESFAQSTAKIQITEATGQVVFSTINTGTFQSYSYKGWIYSFKVIFSGATASNVHGFAVLHIESAQAVNKPNLKITMELESSSPQIIHPKVFTNVTIRLEISNVGDVDATQDAFTVSSADATSLVLVTANLSKTKVVNAKTILPAGESMTATYLIGFEKAGPMLITATVDPKNEVVESNENDNTVSRLVLITKLNEQKFNACIPTGQGFFNCVS